MRLGSDSDSLLKSTGWRVDDSMRVGSESKSLHLKMTRAGLGRDDYDWHRRRRRGHGNGRGRRAAARRLKVGPQGPT